MATDKATRNLIEPIRSVIFNPPLCPAHSHDCCVVTKHCTKLMFVDVAAVVVVAVVAVDAVARND